MSCLRFQSTLEEIFEQGGSWQFSLKIILNSDDTESKDDYINNNVVITELLLYSSCYLSALYVYMHRAWNPYNTPLIFIFTPLIFIFPDEEIELIRG